ncbi:MAG: exopolyphosphatase, partial [Pseudomonadota bacterium]
AMRFGAMLWMEKDADRGEIRWFPKKKVLELRLSRDAMPLFGEVAEARLNSLAASLEAEVQVKTRRG